MIFQYFKVSPIDPQADNNGEEVGAIWKETCIEDLDYIEPEQDITSKIYLSNKDANIFNVMNFPTVSLEIDFNEPLMSQNKMIKMVDILEQDSPVGNQFGISKNVGEGFVFTFKYRENIHRFKVKGEKHAKGAGKVKTLKPVDEVFEQKKITFVNDYACKEARLDQMYTEIVHSKYNGDASLMTMNDIKMYLGLVFKDVIKEESDIMAELGLEPKPLNGMISKVSVTYFKSRLDSEVGL